MTAGESDPFATLVGEQLSSVEFVQDYVQLRFDGPCLTAFTRPRVRLPGAEFQWETPGYRDALCARIATKVRDASISEDEAIRIRFEDGAIIEVSLQPEPCRGPEAAMFVTIDQDCWVW